MPFNQERERLTREYKKGEALERLEKIKELKEKRLTIKEIVERPAFKIISLLRQSRERTS